MKWRPFLYDVVALGLAFLLAVYVKLKVGSLMGQIEEYTSQFDSLNLTDNTYATLMQFESLVQSFSGIVYLAYFFIIVVLPLGCYLLFLVSQGRTFSLLLDKKFSFKYFLKYFLVGLPFVVVLVYILNKVFTLLLFSFNSWWDFFILGLYFILVFLISFVWYTLGVLLVKKSVLKSFKGFMFLIRKRFFKVFVPFIGVFVCFSFVIALLGILFVRSITWSFFGLAWVGMVLGVLVLVWVLGLIRERFVRAIYNR